MKRKPRTKTGVKLIPYYYSRVRLSHSSTWRASPYSLLLRVNFVFRRKSVKAVFSNPPRLVGVKRNAPPAVVRMLVVSQVLLRMCESFFPRTLLVWSAQTVTSSTLIASTREFTVV